MKKNCKRNHLLNEDNAHWHKRADGRRYFTCRTCHRLLQKLRYRNNDAYRTAEQNRSRAAYHARKDQHT